MALLLVSSWISPIIGTMMRENRSTRSFIPHSVLVSQGCITNHHRLESLKMTEVHPVTALKKRNLTSTWHDGWLLLKTLKQGLSHAPLPAFGGFLQSSVFHRGTFVSISMCSLWDLSLSFFSYKDASYIWQETTLTQYDVLLTSLHRKEHFTSK